MFEGPRWPLALDAALGWPGGCIAAWGIRWACLRG
jgi:hypothetical protein